MGKGQVNKLQKFPGKEWNNTKEEEIPHKVDSTHRTLSGIADNFFPTSQRTWHFHELGQSVPFGVSPDTGKKRSEGKYALRVLKCGSGKGWKK